MFFFHGYRFCCRVWLTYSVRLALIISMICVSFYSVALYSSNSTKELEYKWGGVWRNVESLSYLMPEEEPIKLVNIYDLLKITKINENGFSYRNAGNDVGYGPNEVTYYSGNAIFTDDHAIDKKNNVALYFFQGSTVGDRGMTLIAETNNKKYFKQKRTI